MYTIWCKYLYYVRSTRHDNKTSDQAHLLKIVAIETKCTTFLPQTHPSCCCTDDRAPRCRTSAAGRCRGTRWAPRPSPRCPRTGCTAVVCAAVRPFVQGSPAPKEKRERSRVGCFVMFCVCVCYAADWSCSRALYLSVCVCFCVCCSLFSTAEICRCFGCCGCSDGCCYAYGMHPEKLVFQRPA